jgi:hypothetical protein
MRAADEGSNPLLHAFTFIAPCAIIVVLKQTSECPLRSMKRRENAALNLEERFWFVLCFCSSMVEQTTDNR